MLKRIIQSDADNTTVIIRFMEGVVFFSEGIQKFLFPNLLLV